MTNEIEELEYRADELLYQIWDIETQLSSRNKTDKEGQRLSSLEYSNWRTRAIHALHETVRQYRQIKQLIRRLRRNRDIDVDDPICLLQRVCELYREMDRKQYQIDPSERDLVKMIDSFLELMQGAA